MRVVFLGSQEIGIRCLETILKGGHEVVGVGTFAPGDHEQWPDDVIRVVEREGLTRIRGRRFGTKRAIEELRDLKPDIIIVVGWRWILPREVLEIPPKGCVGIHGSLLPRLRGFAPTNWALLRDEPRTGPSLYYFDEGADTGDLVGQRSFEIGDEDDASTLRRRLVEASAALLEEYLPQLAAGTAPRIPQSSAGATYGERRRPEDGLIDWKLDPRSVFNWIRGLTRPWPGAFTWLGGRKVFVWKSRVLEGAGPGPGMLARDYRDRVVVGVGAGLLEILDASFEGDDSAESLERVAHELLLDGSFTLSPIDESSEPPSHSE
jgi:methionyl-tRNA formyltransferase